VSTVKEFARRSEYKLRELCELKKKVDFLKANNSHMEKEYKHLMIKNEILECGSLASHSIEEAGLQREYDIELEHHQALRDNINELEDKIEVLEVVSEEKVIKAMTNHEPIFQVYLDRSTGKSKLATMINNMVRSLDEGCQSSETCCEGMQDSSMTIKTSNVYHKRMVLHTHFVLEDLDVQTLSDSGSRVYESRDLIKSDFKTIDSKVLTNQKSKFKNTNTLIRTKPKK